MTRIAWLFAMVLFGAGSAQAQFRIDFGSGSTKPQRGIDLNRAIDTAKSAQQSIADIDEKQEIEIGREFGAVLLGAAPLVADEAMQRYVQSVGRWLASQTERPDLPWQFGVLDAPQLNAFATPGGYVFVTRGLVERMRSEAELAGVLAHEIAHVLQKHHLKAVQTIAQQKTAAGLLSMIGSGRSASMRGMLVAVASEMYLRGLDRGDELEADRLGVVIAARAGYDPYGLPVVLQMLQAINPEDANVSFLFKTHPAPGDRLDAIDKQSAMLEEHAGQPQVAERFVSQTRPQTGSAEPRR
jgi:predicted Zn-dependent protease